MIEHSCKNQLRRLNRRETNRPRHNACLTIGLSKLPTTIPWNYALRLAAAERMTLWPITWYWICMHTCFPKILPISSRATVLPSDLFSTYGFEVECWVSLIIKIFSIISISGKNTLPSSRNIAILNISSLWRKLSKDFEYPENHFEFWNNFEFAYSGTQWVLL